MSSISLAHKIKASNFLHKRGLILIVLAALVVTLALAILSAFSLASPASQPFDYAAYRLYRQGEWISVPVNNAEAYQLYRQGEWDSVAIPAVDLTAYYQSERTLLNPQAERPGLACGSPVDCR